MKKRFRQHVNPLKMNAMVPRDEPLRIPDGPAVEVELGCGDARFLIRMAQTYPDVLFVGLDIRSEFLELGRAEVRRLQLDNVMLQESNLIVDLDRLFSVGRVRRCYINFPDPWFKTRQHNRRWLNAETLSHLLRTLQRRGELFYQSDVWELALDALGLFEAEPGLANTGEEWSFLRHNPFPAQTSRELSCLDEGRPIWRMLFIKLDADEEQGEDEAYD